MKDHIDYKINRKMTRQDKLYGTTTVGARGQVVIPAEARKDLGLKPGDQLLVIGKLNKALGLIKADQLEELINIIMENLGGSRAKQEVRNYMSKVFGSKIIK